jgi:hypothetical protein
MKPHIQHAAKVSIDFLESEIKQLKMEYEETKRLLASGELADEAFTNKVGKFLATGQGTLENLIQSFRDTQQSFKQLVNFFCEDPSQMKPDEFFGCLQKFIDGFSSAKQDNERELRAKQKKEAKAVPKQQVEQGKGMLDDLADSLRSGDVFRRRLQQQSIEKDE